MKRQLSSKSNERFLEVVGGADEKINDLQTAIDAWLLKNAEAIRRNEYLEIAGNTDLNARIDEIVTSIWIALDIIRLNLPRIADGSASEPHIWSRDFPTPAVNYGPEQKPTLPIIRAFDPHLSDDASLAEALRNLLTISGDKNRDLGVFAEARVLGMREYYANPDTVANFTIGFVPKEDTEIQTAFVERAEIVFSHPNALVPYLREILEVVEMVAS